MSRNSLFLAAFLLLALSVSAEESGEKTWEFDFFGTSTTYFEVNEPHANNPDDESYSKIKEVLTLNLVWKNFTIGGQGEYINYSDPEIIDPLDLDRLRKTWELRKYYIDYAHGAYSARIGTFFSSFGRGLTLFVQKNDALNLDEPIHGLKADATLGRFDFAVLGGEVSEPVLSNQFNRRFKDKIWGGRIIAKLPGNTYLGGSYVGAELDALYSQSDADEVEVYSIEGGAESIAGRLDLNAEWAEMENTSGSRVKDGYGRYISASTYFGPVTILGEYKDYWNFRYRYNMPPNAGRDVESYDHNDVKGARILIQGEIMATGTVLYGSYGDFDSHKAPTSLGGTNGDAHTEWYVMIEETTDRSYFEGAYFTRVWKDRGIDERHINGDFHFVITEGKEAIIGFDERLEKASYFRLATDRTFAAFSWAQWGTLSVRYAWTEASHRGSERFWGGELEFVPNSNTTLMVFVGSDPGGLVCSGGQCREEPRFKGYKARFSWRF